MIVRLYQSLTIRPSIREAIECTHAIIVCMGFFCSLFIDTIRAGIYSSSGNGSNSGINSGSMSLCS